jgi:hypothetical protein
MGQECSTSTKPEPSLSGVHRREVLRRHPILFPLIVIIALGSPFLGLALTGFQGVIVGVIINIIALVLGFRAVMLIVREMHFRA